MNSQINKRFFGILIFLIAQLEGRCQHQDYQEKFEYTVNLLQEKRRVSDEILISLIPRNDAEFKSYYGFYLDPEWKNGWDEIDKKIGGKVYQGKEPFFTDIMNMSAFVHRDSVDEEFLTDFYYDIDFVIENNNDYFCKIYPTLEPETKKSMADWMELYCE